VEGVPDEGEGLVPETHDDLCEKESCGDDHNGNDAICLAQPSEQGPC